MTDQEFYTWWVTSGYLEVQKFTDTVANIEILDSPLKIEIELDNNLYEYLVKMYSIMGFRLKKTERYYLLWHDWREIIQSA